MMKRFRQNAIAIGLSVGFGGCTAFVGLPAISEFTNGVSDVTAQEQMNPKKKKRVEYTADIFSNEPQSEAFNGGVDHVLDSFTDPYNRLNRYMGYAGLLCLAAGAGMCAIGAQYNISRRRRGYYN